MFPVLLRVGPFEIATYGVLVAAAYLTGILWLNSQMKNMGLSEENFWGLVYSIFGGALAGAKILYMIVGGDGLRIFHGLSVEAWRAELWALVDFLRYGWVFYGGLLGGTAAGVFFIRRRRLPLWRLADYFGVALPMSHWLGRMGCLAAGCCYGRPTEARWAIRFTDPRSILAGNAPGLLGIPLHPTQIYEGMGDILIACALYRALLWVRKRRLREGSVFLGYVLMYAALRFTVEFFRGDDRGGFLSGLSVSQWTALASFAAAAGLLVARSQTAAKS